MDYEALIGRAAQFSPDAFLIVQKSSGECDAVTILHANNAFLRAVGVPLDACDQLCAQLSMPDFTDHAILSLQDVNENDCSYRVSMGALPVEEVGRENCFILNGRPSGRNANEGRQRLYGDIARKFIDLPTEEAVRAAMRLAGLYFGADRCFAARVNLSNNYMQVRYNWRREYGFSRRKPGKAADPEIWSWSLDLLKQGETVTINRLADLPNDADAVRQDLVACGAKSALFTPVLLANNSLWFVGLHTMTAEKRWTADEIASFRVVGDLLGNALTQSEIVGSLRDSERRVTDIGAHIPGVVFQLRRDGFGVKHFSYISQGVRELTGWGPASMMENVHLLEDLVIDDDRDLYRETMEQAAQNMGEWSLDVRMHHRQSKEIRWVRASGRVHAGANGDTVWNGLLLDISRRKQAEKAVRASEERLRQILGTSPISIGISDLKTFQLVFANRRLSEMFKISRDEVMGFDARQFYVERRLHRRHWVETQRKGSMGMVEVQCRRTDGTTFWAQLSTRLIDFGGKPAILWWAFDITEHKQARETLAHLAHHDALTGLANRRLFEEHLRQAVSVAKRTRKPGILIYFDLDGFKSVNDSHGHGFGDWVLKQVAQRVNNVLRETDIAARLGGDEFAVVAQNIGDIKSIETIVEKLQNAISEPYVREGMTGTLGMSTGVLRFFGDEIDLQKMVLYADKAMYDAKQAGKGTYRLINMSAGMAGEMAS